MTAKIYVIAQHDGDEISSITLELLAFARQLKKSRAFSVILVMVGDGLSSLAQGLADQRISVILLDIPSLAHYHGEFYKQALSAFFSKQEPGLICTAHTAQGMDFSPGLAVQLRAAHISGVQAVEVENGILNFLRAMDNGKQMAWVSPRTDWVVLSVRPGVYKPKPLPLETGDIASLSVLSMGGCWATADPASKENDDGIKRIRFKGLKQARRDIKGLSEARAILSVGNGIGSEENLAIVHEIAGFFHKSAVGGSRIVCDRGQLGYGQQVGITGAVVAPELYMAWGISGAAQHIAGMEQSEFVVSINKDDTAPMMNTADVCIVEDLNLFLPIFLGVIRSLCGVKKNP